ncbi:NnrU family protein [Sandaracinobacter sp. RS1-74]|uniref:NnrU family protein n=1 Tax=Sandaracinobacteroides sayramensis TaxID=2913411 RepID=UPI001EDC29CD|nr:NnrU family protein [Sandaracinobacteroides sayramensis]MCG2841021.1 NnrU family protein [Sandaracinobacteroides sayramensis]
MTVSFLLLLAAFVLTHIGLATPFARDRLVARLGEKGFLGVYSLVSLLLLGGAIFAYRQLDPYPVWAAPGWAWLFSSALMLGASILFVGSLTPANKGLAGVPVDERPASGVLRITRHPMMWAFAIWAIVHAWMSGSLPTVVLAFGIGALALIGAAHQDVKKRRLLGGNWVRYERQTSYWPLGAQFSGRQPWSALWPGAVPVLGGALLWGLATFVHPMLMRAPAVPPWGALA